MSGGQLAGVILAGGRGRRMGGSDKGLQELCGRPLVAWVVERFAPQVDELLISANRNGERYAAFAHRVVPDAIPGFAGPLAGLHAALTAASHPLLASVPCDAPLLPTDLVSRLLHAMHASGADLAVACSGERTQPVCCLCRRDVLPSLSEFLARGGRKVEEWHALLRVQHVPFDDYADAFANINSGIELERFAAIRRGLP